MSKYSEYIKQAKENQLTRFFGDIHHTSNKYFTFNRVIDDDNFIIITNNIKTIKDSKVMIVGSNKVVYLKEWQIVPVHNYFLGIDTYAIKLNRKFFKTYTFKSNFEGYEGMEEQSFDSLLQIAKEQDEQNMKVSCGHMGVSRTLMPMYKS